ncbi:N-acetyltransferase [Marinilabiliaceae bacterium JC017]|nr:N-acetyltransferase [Marinilabiliaceae bacterium JC017]
MNVIIQKTNANDYFQTEHITREAFWNLYKPGCDEHLVLHNIRKSKSYLHELDLIAVSERKIIGHITSTKARVVDSLNNEHKVLCVGPLSVLPSFQKKGIGTKLLNYSISQARKLGFSGMILFGNPDYYHRFGFKNAKEYEITTKDFQNFEPFMALELYEKGMQNMKGRFFEDEAFTISERKLIEFDKKFPHKEKQKTDTQFK